jgi:serine/threonine protein phosphatase PrpC
VTDVFTKAYKKLDFEFWQRNEAVAKSSGAAVVSVLILGNTIFCINLGDSRAVLCRNGKAVELSVDHKATFEREKLRV